MSANSTTSFRLPVSGREIRLRRLCGREEILLIEAPALGMALALALLESLSETAEGEDIDWPSLSVADIDTALLRLRQASCGDLVRSDVICPARDCGERIEASFSLDAYLAHHSPRRPRNVEADADPMWFRFSDGAAAFRAPTGADLVAATARRDPQKELASACVRPSGLRGPGLKRALAALEAVAPALSEELSATCPACGATVAVFFDARGFALRELRDQASFVYADAHMLARHYHWSEAEILALPRERRIRYAEMLRQEERTA